MSLSRLLFLLVSFCLSAGWVVYGALAVMGARRLRFLSDLLRKDDGPSPAAPSVSVVVTARDEADVIEATVRSLLRQRHPALELILVDDRSTDGTGAILDRLAAEAGPTRFQVIHVAALPEGWLGKCHACHVGAERARGEWLLFLDADVTLGPEELLARTVRLAERRGIDHLPVLPDMRPVGVLQGALLAVFEQALFLHMRFWEMEQDRRRGGSGVGAFNLVRREAYERVGGHARLRLEVAEDYKLGMLLKESGARQRLLSGLGVIFCPWHTSAFGIVRGLEKNFFGGTGYSVGTVVLHTLAILVLQAGPAAFLLAGIPWPFLMQQGVLLMMLQSTSRRLSRSPFALWVAYPCAVALLLYAYWNSTIRTLRDGGVRWRDTFYPLDVLRRGVVRPGDGRSPGAGRRLSGAPERL
ncbi:MAG TPA: glycosyltransferase family 2 protein [Candidatus Polarisedimenticolia bacterium]|nr:glycosyltransferase family 2 protein [Candidatus Polarisedimenticolia bacterium]